MLVENYSNSRQVNPVGFLAIFNRTYVQFRYCHMQWRCGTVSFCGASRGGVVRRKSCFELHIDSYVVKLTWLALGEDQAARSRRVEQLIAL